MQFFHGFFASLMLVVHVSAQELGDYVIPAEAMVERVPYEDSNGTALVGFVSTPPDITGKVPALIFIQYVVEFDMPNKCLI